MLYIAAFAASNELVSPVNTCTCPGDTLMYMCLVVGPGAIITTWGGTAFDCPSSSNTIALLHSQFSAPAGAFGHCTNGTIVGQSLRVEGNCYSSKITVTVSLSLNDATVQCEYDTGGAMIPINTSRISVISG